MEKELAIVVTHGIGSQKPAFAKPMMDELDDKIRRRGKNPGKIAWMPVYWQDIVEPAQMRYFRAARNQGDLDYLKLRKFVLTSLGDAARPGAGEDPSGRMDAAVG